MSDKIVQNLFLQCFILFSLVLFSFSSCIKDDLSNCPIRFSLQIQALNDANEDITSTGKAGNVQLYIFDNNYGYMDQLTVDVNDVENHKILNLSYTTGDNNLWVVAWSNLNGNQLIVPSSFEKGTKMEDVLIQLKRDADSYAENPDDLFYGLINVNEDCSSQQITIRRITALLSITLVGANPQPQDDYYIIISGAKQDALNFKGNLAGIPISYKQAGGLRYVMDTSNTFKTVEPIRVLPLSTGNRFTIFVYKGKELIATADRNVDGTDIIPRVGVTNNILIDIARGQSSVDVEIKVTDWGDLYQWSIW